MARTESTMLELGTLAPDFALPNVVTGQIVRRDEVHGKGLLVMFICTHCPYVKHVERELAKIGAEYEGSALRIVAISSNDATMYPDDGPEGLKQQAETMGFRFPYLHDEMQEVAKTYKAACTPDFFLFDRSLRLVYRGQLDGSRPGNGIPVTGENLRAAMNALLTGEAISEEQRPSLGCNIKWKA